MTESLHRHLLAKDKLRRELLGPLSERLLLLGARRKTYVGSVSEDWETVADKPSAGYERISQSFGWH